MEDLEDKITTEQERKKEAEEKLQNRNKLLVGIREGLDHLVTTLVSNSLERISILGYAFTSNVFVSFLVAQQKIRNSYFWKENPGTASAADHPQHFRS